MKRFVRIKTDDAELNKLQDRLEEYFRSFDFSSILDGHLLEDVALVNGSTTTVPHGLGRVPKGLILVKSDPFTDVQEDSEADRNFLYLQATTADSTISLWVF